MPDPDRIRFSIHRRPEKVVPGPAVTLFGIDVSTVVPLPAADLCLAVSFPRAVGVLERLPRMYIEPDGALLWACDDERYVARIEGMLYDRGATLDYVELSGVCNMPALEELLHACGWPDDMLLFQIKPESVYINEADLRLLVSAYLAQS